MFGIFHDLALTYLLFDNLFLRTYHSNSFLFAFATWYFFLTSNKGWRSEKQFYQWNAYPSVRGSFEALYLNCRSTKSINKFRRFRTATSLRIRKRLIWFLTIKCVFLIGKYCKKAAPSWCIGACITKLTYELTRETGLMKKHQKWYCANV